MVGEGSEMGDKCSVKKSVIGRHCRIGSNVKVLDKLLAPCHKTIFILSHPLHKQKFKAEQ